MKSGKRVIAVLLTLMLSVGMRAGVLTAAEEDPGFKVTFVADHASIDVYYTQDYSVADETGVTTAYARSSSTGNMDTSGDGQVNFKVTVDDGYVLKNVSADKNYKNLKGQDDTGVENMYRLTKITGEVTVTVSVAESAEVSGTLKINEVNSSPDDWVEMINTGNEAVELTGYEIRDNSDDHRWRFADGTMIGAGEILLVSAHTEGLIYNDTTGEYVPGEFQEAYGLGAGDSIRLYDGAGSCVDSYSWTEHASYNGDASKASYGRYPDGTGEFVLMSETPGAPNEPSLTTEDPGNQGSIAERLNAAAWPGPDTVTVSDLVFEEDSSGLDFANGKLYAVDNGTAKLWVIDVAKDGTLTFAEGYENGKPIRFQKDADNAAAAGPDTEGITVDDRGYVYAASERDNGEKGINYNTILMVDPNAEGNYLVAMQEWDITNILPDVSANMGIEAVEWISNADVEGALYDENTQSAFDAANYPNAVSGGIFFVALESNGHVYAFVLNDDGTAEQIADLDSGIGGAMALDFDTYENVLWVAADNGYDNISAKISFNGTSEPDITYVAPAKGMDITDNNEGFAIADAEYTVNGLRAVYHFTDGVKNGALKITYLYCDYTGDIDPSEPGGSEGGNTDGDVNDNVGGGAGDNGEGNVGGDLNYSGDGNTGSNQTTGGQAPANSNSAGTHSNGSSTSSPKTGDSFSFLYPGIALLCSVGIAGVICVRKLKKNSKWVAIQRKIVHNNDI